MPTMQQAIARESGLQLVARCPARHHCPKTCESGPAPHIGELGVHSVEVSTELGPDEPDFVIDGGGTRGDNSASTCALRKAQVTEAGKHLFHCAH
jgi:hypothetical protein